MNPNSIEQAIQFNKTGLKNAASSNSMNGKNLGKQDFLNLLMTQMANQDPLDPMKSENMMQQLAAMGTVEQLQNLNSKTNELIGMQADISRSTSGNLLGKDVEIGSQTINLNNGNASPVSYRINSQADKIQLVIHNDTGEIVNSYNLENTHEGIHNFQWDGKDSDGDNLNNGTYHYTIFAKNSSGEDIKVSYSKTGQVNMVRFEGSLPLVQINGEWVHARDIMSIDDRSNKRYEAASPLPLKHEIESKKNILK